MTTTRTTPQRDTGEWRPCRAHESFDGPYFDIDPEDAEHYNARPFVRIESSTGKTITTAHDLFKFAPGIAEQICMEHHTHPALLAALEEIAKGEGAYSRDPLKHAENTIESMKEIARSAIAAARGEK